MKTRFMSNLCQRICLPVLIALHVTPLHAAMNDFDGDGRSDFAVHNSSVGDWYVLSADQTQTIHWNHRWGGSDTWPVPGDYNGDGTTQLATFNPTTQEWRIDGQNQAPTATPPSGWFWSSGFYQVESISGCWYLLQPESSLYVFAYGGEVPGWQLYESSGMSQGWNYYAWPYAYNADQRVWYFIDSNSDLWAHNFCTAQWSPWQQSSLTAASSSSDSVIFGSNGCIPVPGDYDGDGAEDIGYFEPAGALWYARSLITGETIHNGVNWGWLGDVREWERPTTLTVLPMPFDYDEDGTTDLAIYYRGVSMPTTEWHIRGSSGSTWSPIVWGSSGSMPVPGKYRSVVERNQYPAGITTYKVKESPGAGDDGTFNTPYMFQFKLGTYARTFPVASHDFDGNGYHDHAVFDHISGKWFVELSHRDGNTTQGERLQIDWGFQGAWPAERYSTIYRACSYGITPW